MDLLPQYYTDDNGNQVLSGYVDPWGTKWRQSSGGGWERSAGVQMSSSAFDSEGSNAYEAWTKADPNRASLDLSGLDKGYLDRLQLPVNDPYSLDKIFNQNPNFRGANVNPYFNTAQRDNLRQLATNLGLSQSDADRAALGEASSHFASNRGELYDEATAPLVIGDDIAKALYAKAGKSSAYTGISDEERKLAIKDATANQQYIEDHDPDTATDWEDAKPVAKMIDAILMGMGSYPFASLALNIITPNNPGPAKYHPKTWAAALAGIGAGLEKNKIGQAGPQRRVDEPDPYKSVLGDDVKLGDLYGEYKQQEGGGLYG